MAPFVKTEGKIICMKGPKLKEELSQSMMAIKLLGLEVEKIEQTVLPGTDMERNTLVMRKIKDMSDKYPRRTTNIKKSPL